MPVEGPTRPQGGKLLPPPGQPFQTGKAVDDHKAQVMPGELVAAPGVAQTNHTFLGHYSSSATSSASSSASSASAGSSSTAAAGATTAATTSSGLVKMLTPSGAFRSW